MPRTSRPLREAEMSITMGNDFGEVLIDEKAREAIELILDMAWSLQMTPMEFIQEFEHGVMTCPCCDAAGEDGLDDER